MKHNTRWTSTDYNELVKALDSGKTMHEISALLGRTVQAIKTVISKNAHELRAARLRVAYPVKTKPRLNPTTGSLVMALPTKLKPENHRKRWTADEDSALRLYFSIKYSPETMANHLKRTKDSVLSRLHHLGLIEFNKDELRYYARVPYPEGAILVDVTYTATKLPAIIKTPRPAFVPVKMF